MSLTSPKSLLGDENTGLQDSLLAAIRVTSQASGLTKVRDPGTAAATPLTVGSISQALPAHVAGAIVAANDALLMSPLSGTAQRVFAPLPWQENGGLRDVTRPVRRHERAGPAPAATAAEPGACADVARPAFDPPESDDEEELVISSALRLLSSGAADTRSSDVRAGLGAAASAASAGGITPAGITVLSTGPAPAPSSAAVPLPRPQPQSHAQAQTRLASLLSGWGDASVARGGVRALAEASPLLSVLCSVGNGGADAALRKAAAHARPGSNAGASACTAATTTTATAPAPAPAPAPQPVNTSPHKAADVAEGEEDGAEEATLLTLGLAAAGTRDSHLAGRDADTDEPAAAALPSWESILSAAAAINVRDADLQTGGATAGRASIVPSSSLTKPVELAARRSAAASVSRGNGHGTAASVESSALSSLVSDGALILPPSLRGLLDSSPNPVRTRATTEPGAEASESSTPGTVGPAQLNPGSSVHAVAGLAAAAAALSPRPAATVSDASSPDSLCDNERGSACRRHESLPRVYAFASPVAAAAYTSQSLTTALLESCALPPPSTAPYATLRTLLLARDDDDGTDVDAGTRTRTQHHEAQHGVFVPDADVYPVPAPSAAALAGSVETCLAAVSASDAALLASARAGARSRAFLRSSEPAHQQAARALAREQQLSDMLTVRHIANEYAADVESAGYGYRYGASTMVETGAEPSRWVEHERSRSTPTSSQYSGQLSALPSASFETTYPARADSGYVGAPAPIAPSADLVARYGPAFVAPMLSAARLGVASAARPPSPLPLASRLNASFAAATAAATVSEHSTTEIGVSGENFTSLARGLSQAESAAALDRFAHVLNRPSADYSHARTATGNLGTKDNVYSGARTNGFMESETVYGPRVAGSFAPARTDSSHTNVASATSAAAAYTRPWPALAPARKSAWQRDRERLTGDDLSSAAQRHLRGALAPRTPSPPRGARSGDGAAAAAVLLAGTGPNARAEEVWESAQSLARLTALDIEARHGRFSAAAETATAAAGYGHGSRYGASSYEPQPSSYCAGPAGVDPRESVHGERFVTEASRRALMLTLPRRDDAVERLAWARRGGSATGEMIHQLNHTMACLEQARETLAATGYRTRLPASPGKLGAGNDGHTLPFVRVPTAAHSFFW